MFLSCAVSHVPFSMLSRSTLKTRYCAENVSIAATHALRQCMLMMPVEVAALLSIANVEAKEADLAQLRRRVLDWEQQHVSSGQRRANSEDSTCVTHSPQPDLRGQEPSEGSLVAACARSALTPQNESSATNSGAYLARQH